MNTRFLSQAARFCAPLSPILLLTATTISVACNQGTVVGSVEDFDENGVKLEPSEAVVEAPPALTASEQQQYLRAITPWLTGRVLRAEELAMLGSPGAIEHIVQGWADEPGLADAARRFIDGLLSTGGSASTIDHSLPGNTAYAVTRLGKPWEEVLTAETCYDGEGQPRTCDTGAPFAAGVLGTRAYLSSRASRFNLTRASTIMRVFACREYPLPEAEEPHIEKARLLVLFRAETVEEQADARAAAGFGNGSECFACHGQFSLHAQPFVRFDETGMWRSEATGLQDEAEDAELGRSFGGLMTSHLADPVEANSEQSQMLGEPVKNLNQAASVLAKSQLFLPCQAKHLLEAVFPVDSSRSISEPLLEAVAAAAAERAQPPSFADLVTALFSSREVIDVYLASLPKNASAEITP